MSVITWELLDHRFVTEPIGLVDVKGKGKIDVAAGRPFAAAPHRG